MLVSGLFLPVLLLARGVSLRVLAAYLATDICLVPVQWIGEYEKCGGNVTIARIGWNYIMVMMQELPNVFLAHPMTAKLILLEP